MSISAASKEFKIPTADLCGHPTVLSEEKEAVVCNVVQSCG